MELSMDENALQTLPLFYTFQDTVIGPDFVAEVNIKGRAMSIKEEVDDHVVYSFNGVEPGGIADEGDTLNESYYAFKNSLAQILSELSYLSDDFEDFKARVTGFVRQVNVPEERDWVAAREAVRCGEITPSVPLNRDTDDFWQSALTIRPVKREPRQAFERVDNYIATAA